MSTILKVAGLALALVVVGCGGGGGVDIASAPNTPDPSEAAQSNATVVTSVVIAAVIQ